MTKFEDEVKLKQFLDKLGIRYGENLSSSKNLYVCTFVDNKSGADLTKGLYDTPIAAVRDYQKVLDATKFPLDDIDLVLNGVLVKNKSEYTFTDVILSPYLYFKRDNKKASKK